MTYDATVTLKFDSTYTPTYGSGFGSTVVDDFLPEEHYEFKVPAADLNTTQYFKLFEKFLLCVGMSPCSIRSGAMSLVFNDYVDEKEQRKICKEYELTMDEDLEDKFQEYKIREEEIARLMNSHKGPMGTVEYTEEEILQTNLEEGV
jgi:predicted ATP-dependent Lon-type protease